MTPMFQPIAAPVEPNAIPLASGGGDVADMPGESWFALQGHATVRNVSTATLTPVLPTGGGCGAAVIVAPGGGYLIGSMANEGWAQARWLADRGIAAFVLKYRLKATPADDQAFAAALVARFAAAAAGGREANAFAVPSFMIDDARAAMLLVNARAAEWNINPERIGYLGFSAGAMIGLGLADRATATASPAFLAAIYPSMAARAVPAHAPPLFAAIAADDQLYAGQGFGLVEQWLRGGDAAELHVYARGGHGFGMGAPGTTSMAVMEAFHLWLKCGGWLGQDGERVK